MIETLWSAPAPDYPTIPAPQCIHHQTQRPFPAPQVMLETIGKPLRGLWIDHVPQGPEIATLRLLKVKNREEVRDNVLLTGKWNKYPYIWSRGHPDTMSPQMTMPDAWFDHDEAKRPPPDIPGYTPRYGHSVRSIISSSLAGSPNKYGAQVLPDLWSAGLLRTANDRLLANEVIPDGKYPYLLWHRMVLDQGWTMRRAAQVLREAGIRDGEICAWTNLWAKPPPGSPPAHSSPEETPAAINRRCLGQLADDGPWPLTRTEAIAAEYDYQRVE